MKKKLTLKKKLLFIPLPPLHAPPVGPRSLCTCGHTGDGPGSQHTDTLTPGHGRCTVRGCACRQFSWSCFMFPQTQ